MSHRHPVYKASFHLAAVLAVVVLLPAVSLAGPVQQQAPEEPATEQPAEQSAEQPAEQPARGVKPC